MTAQPQKKITPTEYLALERSSLDIKHKFFDGELFDMVGAKKKITSILMPALQGN
ncbi:hypothetical protein [Desulfobacter hydrogenophilus]|uniref:hypothetical protein n=1 Tax=Desulfobacter hydrogenophilus TaxID=2291 RepID=UPI0026A6795C|nr:hypothetical protein [Desulfobacter hydrogenophilus]